MPLASGGIVRIEFERLLELSFSSDKIIVALQDDGQADGWTMTSGSRNFFIAMNRVLSYLHAKSREEKFRLFVRLLNPTPATRILNVGASGPNLAFAEQFESLYEYRSQVTGGGISLPEVQDYRRSFPGVKSLVFNGCALPFRDKSFDVVYSNAVIEHLADHDAQQRFAAEVTRVGRGWFVTTPNLWYPIEPHYICCWFNSFRKAGNASSLGG